MTREDLISNGYTEELCKIGNLYFKGDFFCSLKQDGSVDYRSCSDDMHSLGIVFNLDEIKNLEKLYYIALKKFYLEKAMSLDKLIEERS